MAEWCYINVKFEGEYLLILQLKELFKIMAEKELMEQQGQMPDWVKSEEGWFFDIDWDENDVLNYRTKYHPNTAVLVEIAEEYSCHFECSYQESAFNIYGRAVFTDDTLIKVDLDTQDFEQFHIEQETGRYHFEGQIYESGQEILEIMLERKLSTSRC